VSWPDGRPATGLRVVLFWSETTDRAGMSGHNDRAEFASVDRSGAYEFPELPAGPAALVVGEFPANTEYLRMDLAVEDGQSRTLDLVLPPLPVLRGRVTSGGLPLADARVRATRSQAEGEPHDEEQQACAADGTFALTLKQQGHYRVRAELPGGGASQAVDLDFAWGLELAQDFILGTGSIAGRIVDPRGAPVPEGAELRLLREGQPVLDWSAAPGGDFDLRALLSGALVLQARSKTCPATSLELQLQDGQRLQGLELRLASGAVVDGEVLDARGERCGAWVYLVTPGEPPEVRQIGAPKGSFLIEALAAGHYRLVVASGSYADDLRDPQTADEARSSEKASVEIDLAAGERRPVTLRTGD
jgi:hypothetical protein